MTHGQVFVAQAVFVLALLAFVWSQEHALITKSDLLTLGMFLQGSYWLCFLVFRLAGAT